MCLKLLRYDFGYPNVKKKKKKGKYRVVSIVCAFYYFLLLLLQQKKKPCLVAYELSILSATLRQYLIRRQTGFISLGPTLHHPPPLTHTHTHTHTLLFSFIIHLFSKRHKAHPIYLNPLNGISRSSGLSCQSVSSRISQVLLFECHYVNSPFPLTSTIWGIRTPVSWSTNQICWPLH